MKKYKKNPTKLLQFRLSEKEHKEILDKIKKSGLTHRAWLLERSNPSPYKIGQQERTRVYPLAGIILLKYNNLI